MTPGYGYYPDQPYEAPAQPSVAYAYQPPQGPPPDEWHKQESYEGGFAEPPPTYTEAQAQAKTSVRPPPPTYLPGETSASASGSGHPVAAPVA